MDTINQNSKKIIEYLLIIGRYLMVFLWSFYEFVCMNNSMVGEVYEKVFPNGYTESDKLPIYLIKNVTDYLEYIILGTLIIYLILVVIKLMKDKVLMSAIMNIILGILCFFVITLSKVMVVGSQFLLNEIIMMRTIVFINIIGIIIMIGYIGLKKRFKKNFQN